MGGRGRIRLARCGTQSSGRSKRVRGWKPRRCSSGCNGNTQGSSARGRSGLCNGIKLWRATEGPAQEVYFGQKHTPGRLCASDFTHMAELGITLEGQMFEHLVYHL